MFSNVRVDAKALADLGNRFAALAKDQPDAMRRAINHTGDKARTAMRAALVPQTGLKRKTINKAVTSTRAALHGSTGYTIKAKGGDIRLKFFSARETRAGVTAAPWSKRRLYPKTFTKGGHFPNRVALRMNGAVVVRAGKARYPLKTVKSGLFIAEELVSGDSLKVFHATVERDLPARLEHEVLRKL